MVREPWGWESSPDPLGDANRRAAISAGLVMCPQGRWPPRKQAGSPGWPGLEGLCSHPLLPFIHPLLWKAQHFENIRPQRHSEGAPGRTPPPSRRKEARGAQERVRVPGQSFRGVSGGPNTRLGWPSPERPLWVWHKWWPLPDEGRAWLTRTHPFLRGSGVGMSLRTGVVAPALPRPLV